jgi:hypothetical protein
MQLPTFGTDGSTPLNMFGQAANFGSAASDFGGAVSDLFSYQGDQAAAKMFGQSIGIAQQNQQIEKSSVAIQEAQQQRQMFMGLGTVQANQAGAGGTAGGSAMDVLRASTIQGGLSHAKLAAQGQIQENAYRQQETAAEAEQAQAKAAGTGAIAGGLFKLAGLAMAL